MLYVAALVLLALLTAGCAGGSAPDALAGPGLDPAAGAADGDGFAGLPSPRETSVGQSVIDVAGSSRSFLLSTAIYMEQEGVGVEQSATDFTLVFQPSSAEQLTYTLFPLFSPLENQAVTLGQLSLDMLWSGAAPSGEHGLYVGVPDYARNAWVWRGPAQSSGDILDYSTLAISGNPADFGFDKIALVNYSDVEVNLRYVGVTTLHPDDVTGDEQLFFLTSADGSFTINAATTGDLDHPTPIFSDLPGVELANLHVIASDGAPLLVFDRRADGGVWEVWQAALDGGMVQLRYGGASDVRFSAITPDAGFELVVEGGVSDSFGDLTRRLPCSPTAELSLSLNTVMNAGGYWYGNEFSPNIALVTSGIDEEGRPAVMFFGYSSYMDESYFVPLVYLNDGEAAYDPFYFKWSDAETFFPPQLTLYSFAAAGDLTNEIRADFVGQPAINNNKTYLAAEGFSLRYPSVSPDCKLLSVVACEPGATQGELYVQSVFLHELDLSGAIAGDVIGTPAWHDPTPAQVAAP